MATPPTQTEPLSIEIRGTSASSDINNLDPIFQTGGTKQEVENTGPKIEELDPIFATNPNTLLKEVEKEPLSTQESTLPLDIAAGTAGVLAGSKVSRLPPASQISQKKFENLEKMTNLAKEEANVQQGKVGFQSALKEANIGTITDEILNAERQVENIRKQLELAQQEHMKYIPESINKQIDPSTGGYRWNKGVVGSLGPIGESSTESARLYNQQKELPLSVQEKFNLTNLQNQRGQGLLVPKTIDPNYISPAHKASADKLAQLENEYKEALKKVAEWKYKHERLATPGNVTAGERKAMTEAERAENALRRAAAKMEEFRPEEFNKLKKMGYFINKIPGLGALGLGLSAGQFTEGAQQFERGNKMAGAMGMMGGAGGALMTIPNPYTIGAGALLSAPPLIYEAVTEGYPYLKQAFSPSQK